MDKSPEIQDLMLQNGDNWGNRKTRFGIDAGGVRGNVCGMYQGWASARLQPCRKASQKGPGLCVRALTLVVPRKSIFKGVGF